MTEDKYFVTFDSYQKIKNVMEKTSTLIEQFKIIINTAPEEFELCEFPAIPVLESSNSDAFVKQKHDPVWSKIQSVTTNILKSVQRVMAVLNSGYNFYPSVEFSIQSPKFVFVSDYKSVLEEFETICDNIQDIRNIFNGIPLVNCLKSLQNEISIMNAETETKEVHDDSLQKLCENAIQKILVVIQNIYKKYKDVALIATEGSSEETGVGLKKDHLNSLVMKDITDDLDLLQMSSVLSIIHEIVAKGGMSPSPLIAQIIPVLEQVLLLYEYFVTQQVSAYRVTCKMSSILLNIFIELSTKVGFHYKV